MKADIRTTTPLVSSRARLASVNGFTFGNFRYITATRTAKLSSRHSRTPMVARYRARSIANPCNVSPGHRQLTLQGFAIDRALYLATIGVRECLDDSFAVRVAVIQREFPNGNPFTLANLACDETSGVVVRMSAFVRDGQQAIRPGLRDNLFKRQDSDGQAKKKFLVHDPSRHVAPEKDRFRANHP